MVLARRPPDLFRGSGGAFGPRRGGGAGRPAGGFRVFAMSGTPKFVVERWTRASAASGAVAAAVIVGLAILPLFAGANLVDKLTTLFVYVILAAMWNALAGYAG